MLKIKSIKIENQSFGCITDEKHPVISYSLDSDTPNTSLASAELHLGQWIKTTDKQLGILYDGGDLQPFSDYHLSITAADNHGETAFRQTRFNTGRMDLPWDASWITDRNSACKKGESPAPLTFRKRFSIERKIEIIKEK